ncbi:hypothetical protein [Microcystis aeruginosa]|uniref:Uncharacterized protein n=1 Tax=Microcystis aeruginosa PCC 9808 TaxID=1160284 RepID=I4I0I9_MICAE|nr:hypothetical protein [Microcystis aeruginosa]CCI27813.1 hypothetical protein MICAG_3650007 [Microcystis aeruginosa PCC 9808]
MTTHNTSDLILQATGQVKILRLALTHLSDSGSIDFSFIEHCHEIEDKLKRV